MQRSTCVTEDADGVAPLGGAFRDETTPSPAACAAAAAQDALAQLRQKINSGDPALVSAFLAQCATTGDTFIQAYCRGLLPQSGLQLDDGDLSVPVEVASLDDVLERRPGAAQPWTMHVPPKLGPTPETEWVCATNADRAMRAVEVFREKHAPHHRFVVAYMPCGYREVGASRGRVTGDCLAVFVRHKGVLLDGDAALPAGIALGDGTSFPVDVRAGRVRSLAWPHHSCDVSFADAGVCRGAAIQSVGGGDKEAPGILFGTLGCVAELRGTPGLITAAHVLSSSRVVEAEDKVGVADVQDPPHVVATLGTPDAVVAKGLDVAFVPFNNPAIAAGKSWALSPEVASRQWRCTWGDVMPRPLASVAASGARIVKRHGAAQLKPKLFGCGAASGMFRCSLLERGACVRVNDPTASAGNSVTPFATAIVCEAVGSVGPAPGDSGSVVCTDYTENGGIEPGQLVGVLIGCLDDGRDKFPVVVDWKQCDSALRPRGSTDTLRILGDSGWVESTPVVEAASLGAGAGTGAGAGCECEG